MRGKSVGRSHPLPALLAQALETRGEGNLLSPSRGAELSMVFVTHPPPAVGEALLCSYTHS